MSWLGGPVLGLREAGCRPGSCTCYGRSTLRVEDLSRHAGRESRLKQDCRRYRRGGDDTGRSPYADTFQGNMMRLEQQAMLGRRAAEGTGHPIDINRTGQNDPPAAHLLIQCTKPGPSSKGHLCKCPPGPGLRAVVPANFKRACLNIIQFASRFCDVTNVICAVCPRWECRRNARASSICTQRRSPKPYQRERGTFASLFRIC